MYGKGSEVGVEAGEPVGQHHSQGVPGCHLIAVEVVVLGGEADSGFPDEHPQGMASND